MIILYLLWVAQVYFDIYLLKKRAYKDAVTGSLRPKKPLFVITNRLNFVFLTQLFSLIFTPFSLYFASSPFLLNTYSSHLSPCTFLLVTSCLLLAHCSLLFTPISFLLAPFSLLLSPYTLLLSPSTLLLSSSTFLLAFYLLVLVRSLLLVVFCPLYLAPYTLLLDLAPCPLPLLFSSA